MMLRSSIAIVVLALGFTCPAGGQTALDEFDRGNAAFREGRVDDAAAAYETILHQGLASPALYFNLGNAYYRAGKIARAILAYERALRLDPNDPDIQHNRDLANLRTVDRIEPLPELFIVEWLRSVSLLLPLPTAARLFALCWIILFGVLTMLVTFSSGAAGRTLRVTAMLSFMLVIPLGVLLASQILESRSHDEAIITAAVVTAKASPDPRGVDAFVVHEGLKVQIGDAVGEWVKLVLLDGKVGWIRTQDCERI